MTRAHLITVSLGSLVLASCLDLPDFENASIVKGPRVLAVIAEPPEIRPGESLELSILIAGVEDPSETRVTWRACGSFDGFFGGGGAQYGEEQPDEGCGGGALAFELGEGPTAQLPGALTQGLFDNLEVIAMTLGTDLPPDIIEQIRSEVGIAFLVEATVQAEGKMVRATKRVLISESPTPHANPPPPELLFGEQRVIADPDRPLSCVREDGEPITAEPGERIELAPFALDQATDGGLPEDEPWLETYNIINARGELREREERAFYAWYATAGELDSGSTKSPLRNNLWTAPREPGEHSIWLIVRDGHGGTSACQITVAVDQ